MTHIEHPALNNPEILIIPDQILPKPETKQRVDLWQPTTDGPALEAFMQAAEDDGLPSEAQERLSDFVGRFLGRTPPPEALESTCALCIGKVQSGKTLSFLALAAAANDNEYGLVIVLAGTKNLLKNQTHREIQRGLGGGHQLWQPLKFDNTVEQDRIDDKIRACMRPGAKRTLVITVLKHTRKDAPSGDQGIDRLAELFEESKFRELLGNRPVLILDDEADEASLDNNTAARNGGTPCDGTATYTALGRLRDCFPRHLFCGFTATPQAVLLARLSDVLSPDVYDLLPPGEGYCGHHDFFGANGKLWHPIPNKDLMCVDNSAATAPESLTRALVTFYTGAALWDLAGGSADVRSMLVHPAVHTSTHADSHVWIRAEREQLLAEIEQLGEAISDWNGHLAELINQVIEDLRETNEIGEINRVELIEAMLDRVENTELVVINSTEPLAEEINWSESACWIFIGGNTLGRGFAIQGLTVTWSPRSIGTGQIDTLTQRARWYGYRGDYLGYCRVWLPRNVGETYEMLARHEESMWETLTAHLEEDGNLQSFIRKFRGVGPGMRMCRQTAQGIRLMSAPSEQWEYQLVVPRKTELAGIGAAAESKRAVAGLLTQGEWRSYERPDSTSHSQRHRYQEFDLQTVGDFLDRYTFFGNDVDKLMLLKEALPVLKDDPRAPDNVLVILMRPDYEQKRTVPADGEIKKGWLQGASGPESNADYPGDREVYAGQPFLSGIRNNDIITIQIHMPRLREEDGTWMTMEGGYLTGGCPLLAYRLPQSTRDLLIERIQDRLRG